MHAGRKLRLVSPYLPPTKNPRTSEEKQNSLFPCPIGSKIDFYKKSHRENFEVDFSFDLLEIRRRNPRIDFSKIQVDFKNLLRHFNTLKIKIPVCASENMLFSFRFVGSQTVKSPKYINCPKYFRNQIYKIEKLFGGL